LGLGVAGLATVRYLRDLGCQVAVSERRQWRELSAEEQEACRGLEVECGGHSHDFVLRAARIIAGPGVPLDLPVLAAARRQGISLQGELALMADRADMLPPVVGVTGSNGKTTVTMLIGELLLACGCSPFVGGNIGTPLLDFFRDPGGHDVLVLELSSFQLDLAGAFRPDIGLLLNLSPDHLDRHGSMAAYTAAKAKLFRNQRREDLAILGQDDPRVMALAPELRARTVSFGESGTPQARVRGSRILVERNGERIDFDLAGTRLDSRVNRLNTAAALLAVLALDGDPDRIRQGLQRFRPPPHRMSLVMEIGGVRFVDDSKATNPGAMAAAIASCPAGVVLIAGGLDKGGDFTSLQPLVRERVRKMVLIGRAAPTLADCFQGVTEVEMAGTLEAAVVLAARSARPGETVLLAPGCASFDQFSGYAQRGRCFARLVAALSKEEG